MKQMMLNSVPQLDYATTEAINTLASNIIFSGAQLRVFMITSCNANEGKSFITFQLSKKMAEMGYRVMLVDADMRKSVFVSRYNAQTQGEMQGLSHYLAGTCTGEEIIYQTNIPNLYIIPSGKEVINSISLLSSNAFPELIGSIRNQYDFVFVDAPPVGVIIDAAMIATSCDTTFFTVANEKVSHSELKSAIQQIQVTGCSVLGVVLNEVAMNNRKSKKYYKSYYSHYGKDAYISDDGKGKKKKAKDTK